ncbi:hypothetical protein GL50803_008974 [Giardia duodenalis]|uniref:Uncharacterized protein n=3 Tax=Giardia intestinalis TaxID=5741 RepID=A8BCH6_GIAIC|nr:hypothetical protein GL50803_008974 [Giardia intestinalis]EFO65530.1 Hypothetical protein GLP15_5207 [Giardia lamblia P15]ESU38808.1 Hypothetical protein DHA2_8974 [Giardia intestinalis]KAE8301372.1 hypothetical protein GL50803_008974 [Giardia intestinalis]|eukprot:XP_001707905.1 Hypothetical protein GL50803_8974 [Giardia lamblia ATCC 50803]
MASIARKVTNEYKRKQQEVQDLNSQAAKLRDKIRALGKQVQDQDECNNRMKQEVDRIFEQGARYKQSIATMSHEIMTLQYKLTTEKTDVSRLDDEFEVEREMTMHHNSDIDKAKETIKKLVQTRDKLYEDIKFLSDERAQLNVEKREAQERRTREELTNTKFITSIGAMNAKIQF